MRKSLTVSEQLNSDGRRKLENENCCTVPCNSLRNDMIVTQVRITLCKMALLY